MNRIQRMIVLLVSGIFIFGLASGFSGCSKDTPFEIEDAGQELVSADQPTFPSGKQINFITWNQTKNNGVSALHKKHTKTKHIKKDKGGTIKFDVKSEHNNSDNTNDDDGDDDDDDDDDDEDDDDNGNEVKIKAKFKVQKNSIDQDKHIDVILDDQTIDFVFGPAGTTFDPPALLTLTVKNVDLTGVDPNAVNIYFVNPNGQWELMSSEKVVVNISKKKIKIKNAKIHHFSRYALSKD